MERQEDSAVYHMPDVLVTSLAITARDVFPLLSSIKDLCRCWTLRHSPQIRLFQDYSGIHISWLIWGFAGWVTGYS